MMSKLQQGEWVVIVVEEGMEWMVGLDSQELGYWGL